ncbi:MAG: IS110 family transposase [Anaerolineae bacterium]|jgi:transposase|nr:IS110 family transposase [Anaerolineae bacterium]MBT4308844.1 IS110 family transposase [Anaerolineae bacterium]MBT4457225.1 IS110 family transposase [Anaerolineae bacterium]MBT4841936.1 IS110 family transposase [Anaerolineae bacterium]MBT6062604.1 IS110 family transposase [Anaerolineae bacterium]
MKIDPKSIPIERYIAMDIHKHYVVVGGMDPQKEWVLRPRKVRMSRFSEWVLKNLNSSDAVVIESTSNAWEIYDLIAPVVRKTVVANPLKVGQIAGAKVKTDRLDVERLLTLLIADIVPEVWVPPHHVRDLRSLISHRWCIQKQITMTKNRLQSFIHRFNLLPPEGKLFSEDNRSWWEEQEFSTMVRFQIEQDLLLMEHLTEHKKAIHQELACLSNRDPWAKDMVFLMQIPDLGIVLSMTVLSAIGDISRFDEAKNLVGYAGLGAGVHDSGLKHQGKGITKAGRKELRWAMVEAAWGAVRSDPYWKAQFQALKKRGKHANQSVVAIARKMLVAVWHVLSKSESRRHSTDEDLAYKMLIWAQRMDEAALQGLSRQQFIKYGLLRLGAGQDLTRIVRNGFPRRIASSEEVLALKPELNLLE